jgi:hypothetical protein
MSAVHDNGRYEASSKQAQFSDGNKENIVFSE